jgi:hypothetical protein
MDKRFTIRLTADQQADVKNVIGKDVKELDLWEGKELEDRIAPAWRGFLPAPEFVSDITR